MSLGRRRDAFYVAKYKIHLDGETITILRTGNVKMCEALRLEDKIAGATGSRTTGRCFVAKNVEVDMPIVLCENQTRTANCGCRPRRQETDNDQRRGSWRVQAAA